MHCVKIDDVINFIKRSDVPLDRDITYATFVIDRRSLNNEPWRFGTTVGGGKLTYPEDAGLPTINMLEKNILFNNVIYDSH